MSVPYSRQRVKVTFTQEDMQKKGSTAAFKNSQSESYDDSSINASTSVSISSVTSDGRIRPPLHKQKADISLLMKDLVAVSKGSSHCTLKRCNSTCDEGMVVFLIEISWWESWMNSHDSDNLKMMDNWSLVKEKPEKKTGRAKGKSSGELPASEFGRSEDQYQKRYHLREDLKKPTFALVTFEVWSTLTAWYGGSPPLPALLVNQAEVTASEKKNNEDAGRCTSNMKVRVNTATVANGSEKFSNKLINGIIRSGSSVDSVLSAASQSPADADSVGCSMQDIQLDGSYQLSNGIFSDCEDAISGACTRERIDEVVVEETEHGQRNLDLYPEIPLSVEDILDFHATTSTLPLSVSPSLSSLSAPPLDKRSDTHSGSDMDIEDIDSNCGGLNISNGNGNGGGNGESESEGSGGNMTGSKNLTATDIAYTSTSATDCGGYVPSDAASSVSKGARVCFVCATLSDQRCSKCMAVYYCGQRCQKSHWKVHRKWCDLALAHRELSPALFKKKVPSGRRGRVGLFNLGNSCYMSSSLQCLSHVFPLTAYFLSNRYLGDVNTLGKDSTGGKLAREYSSLLSDLWFEEKSAVSPVSFKRLLGKLNSDYAGLQQQDAHEVVEHLLDQLHEDLNLVTSKKYTEKAEGNGFNDDVVASAAWSDELLREDSEVKEIFGGQLRSQLVCPDCAKVTVYFEYHRSHQLAIPRSTLRSVQVLFVPASLPATCPVMASPKVDRLDSVGAIKAEISGLVSTTLGHRVSANEIDLMELSPSGHSVCRFINESTRVGNLRDNITIAAYVSPKSDLFDSKIVMLQRRISYGTAPGNDGVAHTAPQPSISLLGVPMMLPYATKWSCARVRVMMWQQIAPFIKEEEKQRDTPLGALLRAACPAEGHTQGQGQERGDITAQLRIAPLLPIRLVNYLGHPAYARGKYPRPSNSNSKRDPSADFDQVEPADNGEELGSSIPHDAQITLGAFIGEEGGNMTFLAMDWISEEGRGWFQLLDLQKIHHFTDSESPKVSRPNGSGSKTGAGTGTGQGSDGSSSFTLNQCLAEYTREEVLDEENARYCSKCADHKRAIKGVKFWTDRLPEVLILSLKRFEFRDLSSGTRSAAHRAKIDSYVDFPIDGLDLTPYCSGGSTSTDGKLYDLFAVTNHYGRLGFGHYTSFARDWAGMYAARTSRTDSSDVGVGTGTGTGVGKNKSKAAVSSIGEEGEGGEGSDMWHSYDDNEVSKINVKDVKSRAAYILFYRKRPANCYPPSSLPVQPLQPT